MEYPSIDLYDDQGCTRLHLACIKGDESTVEKLINNGADVNLATDPSKNPSELTPLFFVVICYTNTTKKKIKHSAIKIFKLLVDAGARQDATAKDKKGNKIKLESYPLYKEIKKKAQRSTTSISSQKAFDLVAANLPQKYNSAPQSIASSSGKGADMHDTETPVSSRGRPAATESSSGLTTTRLPSIKPVDEEGIDTSKTKELTSKHASSSSNFLIRPRQQASLQTTSFSVSNSPKNALREAGRSYLVENLSHLLNVNTMGDATVDKLTRASTNNILQTINVEELTFIKKLGEGAYGEVWKGLWNDSIKVAIKKIRGATQTVINRAKQEASLLMNNRCSNIVLFYGVCEGSELFLVTELMEGGDLSTLLHEDKVVLTPRQQKILALDIVSGLCFLHSQTPMIVHRDLKSMNILLDRSQTSAKIADFGLAETKNSMSVLSKVNGTYNWMAPEVMQAMPHTENVDIYSLGMVLYELTTNQIPFAGCNQMQLYHKVVANDERPPIDLVPKEWQHIIVQCWDRDPTKRPAAKQVLKMIDQI